MQQTDLMLTCAQIGMALAAFSLLPFVPAELRLPDATSWRLASAACSVAAVAFLWHSLRRNRQILGRVLIAGGVTAALLALCAGLAVALAIDALGALPGIESGVCFAALFLHFLAAAFFSIRLLYGALPDAEA